MRTREGAGDFAAWAGVPVALKDRYFIAVKGEVEFDSLILVTHR
jgi:hypothetical protein